MTKETFARYDSADYLKTEEDIAAYLEAVMFRVGLNKALSGEGNPTLSTVMKVAKALGLKVSIQPGA